MPDLETITEHFYDLSGLIY